MVCADSVEVTLPNACMVGAIINLLILLASDVLPQAGTCVYSMLLVLTSNVPGASGCSALQHVCCLLKHQCAGCRFLAYFVGVGVLLAWTYHSLAAFAGSGPSNSFCSVYRLCQVSKTFLSGLFCGGAHLRQFLMNPGVTPRGA